MRAICFIFLLSHIFVAKPVPTFARYALKYNLFGIWSNWTGTVWIHKMQIMRYKVKAENSEHLAELETLATSLGGILFVNQNRNMLIMESQSKEQLSLLEKAGGTIIADVQYDAGTPEDM